MYHSVLRLQERNEGQRNFNPAYCLSVERFREQMEYIHKNGYRTLHLDQLLNETAQIPDKSLILTFDDGWACNYTNAFPILKEYSLTGIIFVVTGFIGQTNYMDWNQLREMSGSGISIQSHTTTHKPLSELSQSEIEYELTTSKKTIEDHLGTQVNFLSLPHGVFNDKVLEMAKEAGYQAVCTSEPGVLHEYKALPVMKRINIYGGLSNEVFSKIIERNESILASMVFSKKMKNLVKKVVGYDLYRKIYNLRYQGKR